MIPRHPPRKTYAPPPAGPKTGAALLGERVSDQLPVPKRKGGTTSGPIERGAGVRGAISGDAVDLKRPPIVQVASNGPTDSRDSSHGSGLVSNSERELVADRWDMVSMVLGDERPSLVQRARNNS